MEENKERIMPITMTDTETGEQYTLDFSRESVAYAERMKFEVDELLKYPSTEVPKFFYYAFRKNHRFLPREKTDKLLEAMGGLTAPVMKRLIDLFQQAQFSNVIRDEDETEESKKNNRFQIEL